MTKEFNLSDWEPTDDGDFILTVKLYKSFQGTPLVQVWEKGLNSKYHVILTDIYTQDDIVIIKSNSEIQGRIEIR